MNLLGTWCAEGFEPSSFWQQTDHTWAAIMRGRRAFHKAQEERDISLAWMMAALSRTEKLEKLEHDLPKKPKPKATLAEELAKWEALASAGYGIKVERLN